ncbi:MAG: CvpA family protein [Saprospiraceae bacterium]
MVIDLIAVLLMIYGLYVGYTRGIIKTVFSLVSIFLGILAALKLSPIVIDMMGNMFKIHPGINFLLGFGITFLLVLMIVRFIGKKLEDFLKLANINVINKSAGAVIMGLLLMVFYSYALFGINKLNLLSQDSKNSSITYTYLESLPQKTEQAYG